MSTAKSSSKFSSVIVLALCLAGCGQALAGALPETENGRYALSPTGDGVLRLDTRTGAISPFNNSGAGWARYAVPGGGLGLLAATRRARGDGHGNRPSASRHCPAAGRQ